MSTRLALVLIGAAAVAVPLARSARSPAIPEQTRPVEAGQDTARVRALLAGVRGAPPLACELAVQWAAAGWYRDQPAPDAAPAVHEVARDVGRRVRDPLAVPLLMAALEDGDTCVRRLALRVVGRSQLPAAREALRAALRSPSAVRRAQGAMGLGLAGHPDDVALLIAALGDADPAVRAAAAWGVGAIH